MSTEKGRNIRTMIGFFPDQYEYIKKIADERRVSVAQVVREIVTESMRGNVKKNT